MAIPDWLKPAIQDRYTSCCGSNDYGGFVDWINELHKGGQIEDTDVDEILEAFFDQTPIPEVEPDDEEGVISYITDPPDPGSMSELPLRRWVRECEDTLRMTDDRLRRMLGITDNEALMDIQENTLRILDGCNDPRPDGDWGERNHQGLVYGMIQSGKTASMISLIASGRKAGYRLFVILAGDKTSLRNQTQERVGEAFDMRTGSNTIDRIFTPTWNDYRHTGLGYTEVQMVGHAGGPGLVYCHRYQEEQQAHRPPDQPH